MHLFLFFLKKIFTLRSDLKKTYYRSTEMINIFSLYFIYYFTHYVQKRGKRSEHPMLVF